MPCCIAKGDIVGEVESFAPIDNLSVGIVRVFSAERRPADQALKHDGANGPPVAAERVAFAGKDLRSDVVRRSDCRVCHNAARFTPCVDLIAVADCEVDLIDVDGMAVVFGF